MRCLRIALSALVSLLAHRASGQTVQLPTFSFTTVSTTVMVPDNGAAFLGGIDRAATGRNEFGLPGLAFPGFQSRGIGQDVSSSNMWVTATIHDFDAMDQAILSTPSPSELAGFGAPGWVPAQRVGGVADLPAAPRFATGPRSDTVDLAGNWRPAPAAAPPVSKVAVEESDRQTRRATRSSEADDYFARGQQAEAEGKPNVAKIYYQMAARRASGDLKQQVQARLDAISARSTALVQSSR